MKSVKEGVMKSVKYLLAGFFLTFLIVATGSAKEKIIFPKSTSPNHPATLNALEFGKMVEKLTNGEMVVKVYPGSSLYKRKTGLQIMTQGRVHIMNPPNSKLVSYSKLFNLIEIPFIFTNNKTFYNFLYGDEGKEILKSLEKNNIVGITFMDEGPFIIATKDRLVKSPDDFKGLKIRTSGHPLMSKAFRMMGASTVKIPLGEVYNAAQQGVIDSAATTLEAYTHRHLYEVLPYVTVWPGRAAYVWVASKLWWNRLTNYNRFIIEVLAKEKALEFNHKVWEDNDMLVKKLVNEHGVKYYVLSDKEVEKMKNKIKTIFDDIINEYGDIAKRIIQKYGQ